LAFGKKSSNEEEAIPIVRVDEMLRTSLVVVKTFTDLKIVAKTLNKPILRLQRIGDTQKFIVLDTNTKYIIEVKIGNQ